MASILVDHPDPFATIGDVARPALGLRKIRVVPMIREAIPIGVTHRYSNSTGIPSSSLADMVHEANTASRVFRCHH